MRKILSLIVAVGVLLGSVCTSAPVFAGQTPEINGGSGILIDATTGEILYEKNIHDQKFPASTTKIITAVLTLENLDLDKVVTIDAETPFTEGSRIYLLEGERVTVEQLLNAMMIDSANDAAVALAKEIAGTVEDFAVMMNEKAKELGALNTNFVNPNGLHEDDHMTTAYDLAVIAQAAMKNEKFREVVTTYRYIIEDTNMQETRYLYNTNRLLYDEKTKVYVNGMLRACKYDGVTGIKTGYTSKAGGTLVAGAKRGNTELIAVVLESTEGQRFADCITLLDYGFANYQTVLGMSDGTVLGEVQVKRGSDKTVPFALKGDIAVTIPANVSYEVVDVNTIPVDTLAAPVKAGDEAGVLQVTSAGNVIAEYDLVVTEDMERGGLLSVFGITDATASKIWTSVLLVFLLLAALLVGYIAFKRRQIKIKKMRRKQRRERARQLESEKRREWERNYESRYYNQ